MQDNGIIRVNLKVYYNLNYLYKVLGKSFIWKKKQKNKKNKTNNNKKNKKKKKNNNKNCI